jgi:hypothetical protein
VGRREPSIAVEHLRRVLVAQLLGQLRKAVSLAKVAWPARPWLATTAKLAPRVRRLVPAAPTGPALLA